ncbi:MAG: hypothetical protein WBQ64_20925 [Terriglobales bacterium]
MRTFNSDAPNTPRWIPRIIMAVILGEAIWGLIVSLMNNVVVPWLGDVMGQSSGLPTSFTQRPYNYPDLFVSILEFGIAALVAAVLNYFFQARNTKTIRTVQTTAPAAEPARMFPQPTTTAALTQTPSPYTPPAPVMKPEPVTIPAPAAVSAAPPLAPAGPATTAAPVTESAAAKPLPTASPAATKPPSAPKAEPVTPKKPKNVYYNIVGEPMPSDDD